MNPDIGAEGPCEEMIQGLREDDSHGDMLTGGLAITLCELLGMKSARLEDARTPVEEWFV